MQIEVVLITIILDFFYYRFRGPEETVSLNMKYVDYKYRRNGNSNLKPPFKRITCGAPELLCFPILMVLRNEWLTPHFWGVVCRLAPLEFRVNP